MTSCRTSRSSRRRLGAAFSIRTPSLTAAAHRHSVRLGRRDDLMILKAQILPHLIFLAVVVPLAVLALFAQDAVDPKTLDCRGWTGKVMSQAEMNICAGRDAEMQRQTLERLVGDLRTKLAARASEQWARTEPTPSWKFPGSWFPQSENSSQNSGCNLAEPAAPGDGQERAVLERQRSAFWAMWT